MLASTRATARAQGLRIDFSRAQVRVTTLPAHRSLWLAGREGDAGRVGEALFHARFAEGGNLAEPAVLVRAGNACGLSGGRVRTLPSGDEGEAEVRVAVAQAQSRGIRSVPTFVIDGRCVVQGVRPPEPFAQALRRGGAAAPSDPGDGPAPRTAAGPEPAGQGVDALARPSATMPGCATAHVMETRGCS